MIFLIAMVSLLISSFCFFVGGELINVLYKLRCKDINGKKCTIFMLLTITFIVIFLFLGVFGLVLCVKSILLLI